MSNVPNLMWALTIERLKELQQMAVDAGSSPLTPKQFDRWAAHWITEEAAERTARDMDLMASGRMTHEQFEEWCKAQGNWGPPAWSNPAMPENEFRLVTSAGTVYRITNTALPKESNTE